MAKKKLPKRCKVCDYIRSHGTAPRINEDLVNGISISAIMQRTGLGRGTLTRHRDEGHMMAGYLPRAHLTVGAKEQLDLMKCAKEIYEDCKDNAAKAKGKAESSRDYRDASGCWDAATRALGVLKVGSPSDHDETESDGFEEALKAKAKDVWKEARPVQMATTESETMADDDLVET